VLASVPKDENNTTWRDGAILLPTGSEFGSTIPGTGQGVRPVGVDMFDATRSALHGTLRHPVPGGLRVAQHLMVWLTLCLGPHSSKCLVGKRACEYAVTQPTLRDRRSSKMSLPGQQRPWAAYEPPQGSLAFSVAQPTRSTGGDPFDALAVQMPLRSQELLYYCEFHLCPFSPMSES